MKKNITFTVLISIFSFSLNAQTKGKYDLDLYQKRLSVIPKVELGLFGDEAPAGFGFDASYFVNKSIQAQTSAVFSGDFQKQDLGVSYFFQNKIITKQGKVFDKTISTSSKGETYQVLLTDVNFHVMKGFRGGVYRRQTSTFISPSTYNLNAIGGYLGASFYNSRNTVNSNMDTGTFAKGRKNYGFGLSADLLIGGAILNLPLNNSITPPKAPGSPIGLRTNLEFSYFLGKNHHTALFTNFEFGKYPKVEGMVAMWGIGFRIDLLDKLITN